MDARKTDCPRTESKVHTWNYTGVRYRDGSYSRPGGSACTRYYGQHYLCVHCGMTRIDRLPLDHDTFMPIQFNASPGTQEEFPIENEKGA